MSGSAAPETLRVGGMSTPVVCDEIRPRFSWLPRSEAASARVEVTEGERLVWDSGFVDTDQPGLTYGGPRPASRSLYRCRVQTRSRQGLVSDWSAVACWETGLLEEHDWEARWISRAVPAAMRPIRSLDHDRIDWVEGGHWIGQSFTTTGRVTGVSLHLTGERDAGNECSLEICDAQGTTVLASRRLEQFPLDRFSHWIEVEPPLPAGTYVARIADIKGRVGWLTSSQSALPVDDDGVSARPIVGVALRDGEAVAGVRVMGAEPVADADPVFAKTFSISGPVKRARLYAVGLGYGEFRINGEPVWDGVLEPAPTMYDKRIHYRAYDVASLLRGGGNAIEATAGRGFFGTRGTNIWGWQLAPFNREPCVRLQLEIIDDAGGVTRVSSDKSWTASRSTIVSDMLLNGEIRESSPARDATSAIEVPGPGGRLEAALFPPIRRQGTPGPHARRTVGEGEIVHDFGGITTGWIKALVQGGAGGEISIKYGEALDAEGNVVCDNILSAGEAQIDRFRLGESEGRGVSWEPSFTYKGFRYAQVRTSGDARVVDVEPVTVHNDVQSVGSFSCADETLTWVDGALRTTFLNNLHGIPTDTPIYEKNGWTADAHLATEAVLHHFDLHAFLIKWLRDHADAQAEDGAIPQIVPTPGWGRALDPAWSASYPLIAWNAYFEYGDRTILEEHIERLLAYVGLMHRIAEPEGWIWQGHSWADWLAPGYGFPPEGPSPTTTLMMLRSTTRTADMCDVLGRAEKGRELRAAADLIAAAYHATYFDAGSGTYRSAKAGYRQSMNVLPLAFGVVPQPHIESVVDGLVRDLRERTGEHLDVGSVATKYLLPVLSAHGHHDLAVTVATQPTRPGWGLWKEAGSNTLWESWDETARSHNHYFLGSIGQWLHEHVAGLKPTSAGWRTFELSPARDKRVPRATIRHQSMRGPIAADWSFDEGFHATLEVPAGSTATLRLPFAAQGPVQIDGREHAADGEGRLHLAPGLHRIAASQG